MDCSTETAMPADKAGITWGEIEHEGDATLSAASGRVAEICAGALRMADSFYVAIFIIISRMRQSMLRPDKA